MLDTDTCNLIAKENQKEERDYRYKMKVISNALQQLHPECDIEIHMKLKPKGLTREQLEEVDNMVYQV